MYHREERVLPKRQTNAGEVQAKGRLRHEGRVETAHVLAGLEQVENMSVSQTVCKTFLEHPKVYKNSL